VVEGVVAREKREKVDGLTKSAAITTVRLRIRAGLPDHAVI
jgi:hypothetical protein